MREKGRHFLTWAGASIAELLPAAQAERVPSAWWRIQSAVGKLGVGFAARCINQRPDNVAKMRDAMALVRENAGRMDGFEFLMVLLRYHMVVYDVAQMPQLNEATRRLGFFFWAIFIPAYIPLREYGEAYIRNHQRVTDAIVSGDAAGAEGAEGAEGAYQYHIEWTDALINGERPDPQRPWVGVP